MSIENHGLSIEVDNIDSNFFLSLKAVGKLTHEDYEVITPMIDSALHELNEPSVKVLFDGTELDGLEIRAAWDDFKLGLKHRCDFDKIAFYGNKHWQEISAKMGAWFIPGDVKYFKNKTVALAWLGLA